MDYRVGQEVPAHGRKRKLSDSNAEVDKKFKAHNHLSLNAIVPTEKTAAAHKVLKDLGLLERIILFLPFDSNSLLNRAQNMENCLRLTRVCKPFKQIIEGSTHIQQKLFLHDPLSSESEKYCCICGGGWKKFREYCRSGASCKTELNPVLDRSLLGSFQVHRLYRCNRWSQWRELRALRKKLVQRFHDRGLSPDESEQNAIDDYIGVYEGMLQDLEGGMDLAQAEAQFREDLIQASPTRLEDMRDPIDDEQYNRWHRHEMEDERGNVNGKPIYQEEKAAREAAERVRDGDGKEFNADDCFYSDPDGVAEGRQYVLGADMRPSMPKEQFTPVVSFLAMYGWRLHDFNRGCSRPRDDSWREMAISKPPLRRLQIRNMSADIEVCYYSSQREKGFTLGELSDRVHFALGPLEEVSGVWVSLFEWAECVD